LVGNYIIFAVYRHRMEQVQTLLFN